MPEGDTIHKLAHKVSRAIVGKEVRALSARKIADDVASSVVGTRIKEVTARGKNLLIFFSDDRALHIHLRMVGRVHVLDRAALAKRDQQNALRRSKPAPELLLVVDGAAITGSRLPVLRLLKAGGAARSPDLASLGPDLLNDAFDEREALARLRLLPNHEIGVALMVQRALAGIGNVFKSEVLFIERTDPQARVRDLDDAELLALIRCAQKLLRVNLRQGRRVTRSTIGEPHYVYLRARKPCFSCGKSIAMFYQGVAPGRSTYHCPLCQSRGRAPSTP